MFILFFESLSQPLILGTKIMQSAPIIVDGIESSGKLIPMIIPISLNARELSIP